MKINHYILVNTLVNKLTTSIRIIDHKIVPRKEYMVYGNYLSLLGNYLNLLWVMGQSKIHSQVNTMAMK